MWFSADNTQHYLLAVYLAQRDSKDAWGLSELANKEWSLSAPEISQSARHPQKDNNSTKISPGLWTRVRREFAAIMALL